MTFSFSTFLYLLVTLFILLYLLQLKTWQNAVSRSLGWIGSTFTKQIPIGGNPIEGEFTSTPSAMSLPMKDVSATPPWMFVTCFAAFFSIGLGAGVYIMARANRDK